MKAYLTIKGKKWTTVLLVGLFGFLFLQGCSTPLVDVNVTVGPEDVCGLGGEDGRPGAGGCSPQGAAGHSAQGFLGVGGTSLVGSGISCLGGEFCANGGRCSFGKKCTSVYNYNSNDCSCECL